MKERISWKVWNTSTKVFTVLALHDRKANLNWCNNDVRSYTFKEKWTQQYCTKHKCDCKRYLNISVFKRTYQNNPDQKWNWYGWECTHRIADLWCLAYMCIDRHNGHMLMSLSIQCCYTGKLSAENGEISNNIYRILQVIEYRQYPTLSFSIKFYRVSCILGKFSLLFQVINTPKSKDSEKYPASFILSYEYFQLSFQQKIIFRKKNDIWMIKNIHYHNVRYESFAFRSFKHILVFVCYCQPLPSQI